MNASVERIDMFSGVATSRDSNGYEGGCPLYDPGYELGKGGRAGSRAKSMNGTEKNEVT